MIRAEVAGATSSMTSVPKPLKFMTPLYPNLIQCYNKYTSNDDFKVSIAKLFFNQTIIVFSFNWPIYVP